MFIYKTFCTQISSIWGLGKLAHKAEKLNHVLIYLFIKKKKEGGGVFSTRTRTREALSYWAAKREELGPFCHLK